MRGLNVVLLGPGEPWRPTYGLWLDEVASTPAARDLGPGMYRAVADRMIAFGHRRHVIERSYGVVDNEILRAWFAGRFEYQRAVVDTVQEFDDRVIARTATSDVVAKVLVDATGSGLARRLPPSAWQTAYGIAVTASQAVGCEATLMDFRPVGPVRRGGAGEFEPAGVSTFGYVVPLGDRWLVEETVLTASPAVPPETLRPLLQRRLALLGLDPDLLATAEAAGEVEQVRIPMNQRPLPVTARVLPYGAAAAMIHPATGYSIAGALRYAEATAEAVHQAITECRPLNAVVASASPRLTRALHRYGAQVLLGLKPDDTREFFDRFFDLAPNRWERYLQIDAPPRQVAGTMMSLFNSSSWSLRRALMLPSIRR
jgi:lycopene beta-cyclase